MTAGSPATRRGEERPCRAMDCFVEPQARPPLRYPFFENRSAYLTIFWRCRLWHLLFRTVGIALLGKEPSMVLAEDRASKGLAMLSRSDLFGIEGKSAVAADPVSIPAVSVPTPVLCGLLLLICP